jgi:hypothetical protein
MFGLAQSFQCTSIIIGGAGRRRRRRDRRNCGGRGRGSRSGLFDFLGWLLFRFFRRRSRLGLFSLMQGLKNLGLIIRSVRGGLPLACRPDADSDTTRHDGEFSVSHI